MVERASLNQLVVGWIPTRSTIEFKVGEGFAVGLYSPERSLVDMIRLRHREGSDIAWEALRRWLGRKGAKPAALFEMAKSLHGAERAVRNALEIVL
jgi:hypothetical protein